MQNKLQVWRGVTCHMVWAHNTEDNFILFRPFGTGTHRVHGNTRIWQEALLRASSEWWDLTAGTLGDKIHEIWQAPLPGECTVGQPLARYLITWGQTTSARHLWKGTIEHLRLLVTKSIIVLVVPVYVARYARILQLRDSTGSEDWVTESKVPEVVMRRWNEGGVQEVEEKSCNTQKDRCRLNNRTAGRLCWSRMLANRPTSYLGFWWWKNCTPISYN